MAPPTTTFPLSSLPTEVRNTTSNLQPKARKLPADFDFMRHCELYELIQYSCTPVDEMTDRTSERTPQSGSSQDSTSMREGGVECWPFRRLFRRCTDLRGAVFHVETTAWEGHLRWKALGKKIRETEGKESEEKKRRNRENEFAKYGSFFWTSKGENT